jgi:protein KRI1
MERPAKKARMLLDNSSDDDSDDNSGGVALKNGSVTSKDPSFKVNAEYARRFEYNKKREERQQCQWQEIHCSEHEKANLTYL